MKARKYVRGVWVGMGFPCRGTKAGRPGDGGGEAMRWLKLKRDDVDDSGAFKVSLYEPARLRLSLGEFRDERIISEYV